MGNARIRKAMEVIARNGIRMARAGELLELKRACAVHDKLFLQRYRRNEHGIYVFEVNITVFVGVTGAGSVSAQLQSLNSEAIDHSNAFCPFCGDEGSTICSGCGYIVCDGLSPERGHFQCRKSCGASFTTERAKTISGTLRDAATSFMRETPTGIRQSIAQPPVALSTSSGRGALGAGSVGLLGDGRRGR